MVSAILLWWNVLSSIMAGPFFPSHLLFYQLGMGPTPFGTNRKSGAHYWEICCSGERFKYQKVLLLLLTRALIGEPWVCPPWRINQKVGIHDQELDYSGEGFTHWKILLPWLTQHLTNEGWVLLCFLTKTQAQTHNQECALSLNQDISRMCCTL